MTRLLFVTVDGAPRTVFVEFSGPQAQPRSPSVHVGGSWLTVLSCRDWFGDEFRDALTAESLRDISSQLENP